MYYTYTMNFTKIIYIYIYIYSLIKGKDSDLRLVIAKHLMSSEIQKNTKW
jgi:hypothetical protein